MEKLSAAVWNPPRAGPAVSPGNSRDPTALRFLPAPCQAQLEWGKVPGPQVRWERALAGVTNWCGRESGSGAWAPRISRRLGWGWGPE